MIMQGASLTVSKEIVRLRLYALCLAGDMAGLFIAFLLAHWLVVGNAAAWLAARTETGRRAGRAAAFAGRSAFGWAVRRLRGARGARGAGRRRPVVFKQAEHREATARGREAETTRLIGEKSK